MDDHPVDLFDAISDFRKSGQKDIADALSRLVTDIGYVVIALKEIEDHKIDGVKKLIFASRTFRNSAAAIGAIGRFRTMLSSGSRSVSAYLSPYDLTCVADILGTTTQQVAGVHLAVDVSNRGIGISTSSTAITSEVVRAEDIPDILFVFMMPKLLPDLIEDINTSIRTSLDTKDRITDMVNILDGTASAEMI